MANINSSTNAAYTATAGVKVVQATKINQINIDSGGIKSISNGEECCNKMMNTLNMLILRVQEISDKFPEIAKIIEIADMETEF